MGVRSLFTCGGRGGGSHFAGGHFENIDWFWEAIYESITWGVILVDFMKVGQIS